MFREAVSNAGLILSHLSLDLNSHCERRIGSLRRDCLDFLIPINEPHLREIPNEYKTHPRRKPDCLPVRLQKEWMNQIDGHSQLSR